MQTQKTLEIAQPSLWDFLKEVQSAVQQGYVLSDKNQHFPQGFVSLYTVTLVKDGVVEDTTKVADVATEVKKVDGRKKVQK